MKKQPVDTTLYSLSAAPPSQANRREDERHLTLYRVGSIVIGSQRELCLIKNISGGGMMIRAYCAVDCDTPVTVELKSGQPIDGTVTWVHGSSVGITFDRQVDVLDLLSGSIEGPRPRLPRIEVDCVASVRDGSNIVRMRVLDVSQGGLKAEGSTALANGTDVVVSLPGLESRPGVVCWSDGGFTGISFNRLLALPILIGWLEQRRPILRATG